MRIRRNQLPVVIAVVAVLVWSWFASGVRTFTRPAEAFTFIPALAVLLVTLWPRRRARRPADHRERRYTVRGVVLWVVVLVAVLSWEMFQLFSKPREHHPTISSLLNSLISSHPSRFAGYLLWLAAGALLARDRVARRD
jgi:purine-cytosine permease-like protein